MYDALRFLVCDLSGIGEFKVNYYKVAVKAPLFKILTYSFSQSLQRGQKVRVPLGEKRTASGVILGQDSKGVEINNIKPVLQVMDMPSLSEKRLKWLEWMSRYYHYPLGLVADLSFPPLLQKKSPSLKEPESLVPKSPKTLSTKESKWQKQQSFSNGSFLFSKERGNQKGIDTIFNSPKEWAASFPKEKFSLTDEQEQCVKRVLRKQGFQPHLLHGVTGSGKTEVYKTLTENFLSKGKQVLILLPEIFLTPQIVERFSRRFPGQVAVWHSDLTARQKTTAWFDLATQKKNILIGTRSALFCPLPQLGLIVVDEEHSPSFKQETRLQYHARDSALMLAHFFNIPILLGSATPSLDSWFQAQKGVYQVHQLKNRAFKQSLPEVGIVDLRTAPRKDKIFWLSEALYLKIKETLEKKKQVALFLNRRGQAGALICSQCGYVKYCKNCDIALSLHGSDYLLCHYCDFMEKKPSSCSECGKAQWVEKGVGTERVEQVIKNLFPKARVFRADRDAIDSHSEMSAFVQTVEKGEADILIGTQMLAKGLDFPSIHLVGLLMADMGFHFPDFRASEHAFQTLLQMAGRAGRNHEGEVILQTFNPDHLSVSAVRDHNYRAFSEEEMKNRRKLFYPPFSRLCLFQVDSLKEKEGRKFAFELARTARKKAPQDIKVLGPSPAPLFKIQKYYRYQILVKAPSHGVLQQFLDDFPIDQPHRSLRVKRDRDPVCLL